MHMPPPGPRPDSAVVVRGLVDGRRLLDAQQLARHRPGIRRLAGIAGVTGLHHQRRRAGEDQSARVAGGTLGNSGQDRLGDVAVGDADDPVVGRGADVGVHQPVLGYVGDNTMSISPPSPLGSTGITILTLGSALHRYLLDRTRGALGHQCGLAVGQPMIRPLVLSRQPCMTPGAGHSLGNGFGGSGGGGGGVVLGPGCSSGSVVNGCDCAASKRAHPTPASSAAHSRTSDHPAYGRRCLMQARLRIVSAVRATRSPASTAARPAQTVVESAVRIPDSAVTSTYPGTRDESP